MEQKDTKNKGGFSLIEVMVAALILMVLVVGGAAMLTHAGSGIQVMGNKHLAMERARTKLEWLYARSYESLRADAIAGNPGILSTNETHKGLTISITSTNRLVLTGGIIDVLHGSSSSDEFDNEYIELSVRATYRGADEAVLMHAIKTLEL